MCLFIFLIFNIYKPKYHQELNLVYGEGSVPITEVEIENKKYKFEIDLGSKFACSISEDLLKGLKNKKKGKELCFRDFKGNLYYSKSFLLPKINFGKLSFKNLNVKIKNDEFTNNTTIRIKIHSLQEEKDIKKQAPFINLIPKHSEQNNKCKTKEIINNLGRAAFKNKKVLFDFQKNKMFISNDLSKLKTSGYDLKCFKKVALFPHKRGIVFNVSFDKGNKKFILDTGFSITAYKNYLLEDKDVIDKYGHKIFVSKNFCIADKDYGLKEIFVLNITPELDFADGILGMDFLKNHIIYIDFVKHELYIR